MSRALPLAFAFMLVLSSCKSPHRMEDRGLSIIMSNLRVDDKVAGGIRIDETGVLSDITDQFSAPELAEQLRPLMDDLSDDQLVNLMACFWGAGDQAIADILSRRAKHAEYFGAMSMDTYVEQIQERMRISRLAEKHSSQVTGFDRAVLDLLKSTPSTGLAFSIPTADDVSEWNELRQFSVDTKSGPMKVTCLRTIMWAFFVQAPGNNRTLIFYAELSKLADW